MGPVQRHLDAYLQSIRPPTLSALAQAWGAAPAASPQAALAAILAVLNDPTRVRQLVASLSAQEQTALALLQLTGGSGDAEALTAALRVLGFPCPSANGSVIGDPLIDLAQLGVARSFAARSRRSCARSPRVRCFAHVFARCWGRPRC